MKLDVGSYIVKVRGVHFGSNHILRVRRISGDKYFQIDAGIPYIVERDNESMELEKYKIVKKLQRKIEYQSCHIEVKFHDDDGNDFVFVARNASAFERIKEQFPRLWDQFQFFK